MNGAEGDEVMETARLGTVGINSKHCHSDNLASCIHTLPPTLNKNIPAKCFTSTTFAQTLPYLTFLQGSIVISQHMGHSMSNQHKIILTLTDLNETWFLHSVC